MPWYSYDDYPRYESVADKRAKAERTAKKLTGKGEKLEPAMVKGTKLAASFWGQSWNKNLERYQDYDNRLPRGRSYVRNGAVLDLKVEKGLIRALVSGSHLYEVSIHIQPLRAERWKTLKKRCAGQIHSLIGLLQGQIPPSVMEAVTKEGEGLFPEPRDIRFQCSCPDYADLCKHSSAAVYGVGARLDERPELLFLLRGVDHTELIESASEAVATQASTSETAALDDLGEIFGIELDGASSEIAPAPKSTKRKKLLAKKAPVEKKKIPARKKAAVSTGRAAPKKRK